MSDRIDTRILEEQLAKAKAANEEEAAREAVESRPSLAVGAGGGHISIMDERIGKLEGAIQGLRDVQNITLAMITLIVLILIGGGVYALQRMDQLSDRIGQLSDRVAALPNQINADLRDIAKTLAESITAAKQTPPQVILMPVPQPAPLPPSPKR